MTEAADRNVASLWRLVIGWTIALGLGGFAWAYASPVGASPDEPAHIAYGWGLTSGQNVFDTHECTNLERACKSTTVTIPAGLVPDASCHAFRREIPASCILDTGNETAQTNMVRYPPPYYVITGGALKAGNGLGLSTTSSGYLARLASVGIFLSLAVPALTMSSRRKPGLIPFVVAMLTPLSMFLVGSVNPSGAEITGGVVAASALAMIHTDRPDRNGVALFLYGLFWLGLSRPLGVLWSSSLLFFGFVYLGFVPPKQSIRAIWERYRLLVGGGGLIVAAAAAWFTYMLGVHSTSGGAVSTTLPDRGLERTVAVPLRWGEMVWENLGVVGWLDTPQSRPVMLGLLALIALIGATSTLSERDGWRHRVAVLFAITIAIGVTLVMYKQGFLWQGRYALPPMAAGFVLLGGAAGPQFERQARTLGMLCWLLSASGIFWLGARYSYGLQRGARFVVPNFSEDAQWFGPLGNLGFVLAGLAALIAVPIAMRLSSSTIEPKHVEP